MKRKPLSDRQRVEHMLEAIDTAQAGLVGLDEAALEVDGLRYFGLVKLLEIIGEAAYKLTPALRQAHPQVAWQQITGMRHVLVHDYDNINETLVWHVLQVELPILKAQLQHILATLPAA